MAKGPGPALALAAVAALFFLAKGKKGNGAGNGAAAPLVPPPDPTEEEPPAAPSRPAGNPPNVSGDSAGYNSQFFNSRQSILDAFEQLGYVTPTDRDTMNDLGADGQLGGDDDKPSAEVRKFQQQYNKVSLKFPGLGMRGLDTDGKVGAHTLNGLEQAIIAVTKKAAGSWPNLVAQA
jgi:hypothetical protein